jgi:hypothetical protein
MKSITDSGNTQRGRILGLLIGARGSWVPLPEILALGIAQYNARIFELRRLGFSIQSYQEGARSFFRLVRGPSMPMPTPIAAACQESLFGDLAPEARYPD